MMPDLLQEFGPDEWPDHYHLPRDTTCYFWGEYTPYEHTGGQNWNFSDTNQLISNFKKKLDRRGAPDWSYKARAVTEIGGAFANMFEWSIMGEEDGVVLIPLPPSKVRTDSMYDSRMLQVLQRIGQIVDVRLDIRDCLSFSGRYGASHLRNDERPTPEQLYADLAFDHATGHPHRIPNQILVFDDVVTAGSHFAAVKRKLGDVFPGVPVYGCFIARRVIPNDDFDDIDDPDA